MTLRLAPLSLIAALAAAGCGAGTRTDTFDIDIKNGTSGPVTLSLAKSGPPYEPTWATPEDLAIESPKIREEWAGNPSGMGTIPPGKTASVKGLTGRFDGGSRGLLRAYAGELTISQMLARGKDSPDRVEVPLVPGANRVVLTDKGGRIGVEKEK
ncbi:MAG: hypothetical protein JWO31_2430 [Phycisphaerales bacterium]|nr:hypothetical protein [Phycisphaerales bacterium]